MEEFDQKLLERRNKELLASMKELTAETHQIVLAINNQDDNSGLEKLIREHIATTQKFLKVLAAVPPPEKPQVTVHSNHAEVVASVREMADQVSKNLQSLQTALENRPKEWTFEFTRDPKGFLKSPIKVTAN